MKNRNLTTLKFIKTNISNPKIVMHSINNLRIKPFYDSFISRSSKALKSRFVKNKPDTYFTDTQMVHKMNDNGDSETAHTIINLLLQMRAYQDGQNGLINNLRLKQDLLGQLERELKFAGNSIDNSQIQQIHNTIINNNFNTKEFKDLINSLSDKKKNITSKPLNLISADNDSANDLYVKPSFVDKVINKYSNSSNTIYNNIINTQNLINRETNVANEEEKVLSQKKVQRELIKHNEKSEKAIEKLLHEQEVLENLVTIEKNTNRTLLSREIENKYNTIANKALKKYTAEHTFVTTNLINRETNVANEEEKVLSQKKVQRELVKHNEKSEKAIEKLLHEQEVLENLVTLEKNTNRTLLSREVENKYNTIANKALKKYTAEHTFVTTNLINRETNVTNESETVSNKNNVQNILIENKVENELAKVNNTIEKRIQNNISNISKSVSNIVKNSLFSKNMLTKKLEKDINTTINQELTLQNRISLDYNINSFTPEIEERESTRRIAKLIKKNVQNSILKGFTPNESIVHNRNNLRTYYNDVIEDVGRDFAVLNHLKGVEQSYVPADHMQYKQPISFKNVSKKTSDLKDGMNTLRSQMENAPQQRVIEEHYGRSVAQQRMDKEETKNMIRSYVDSAVRDVHIDVDDISRQIMNKIEKRLELERKRCGISR